MAHLDRLRDRESEFSLFRTRAAIAGVVVVLLLGVVFARLLVLQYADHGHYTTLSDDNRVRLNAIPPTRGLIRDRNGVILAENLPSFTLHLVPEQVDDLSATLDGIGELIELEQRDVDRLLAGWRRARPFEGVPLRFRLNAEEVAVLSVELHRFPGVEIVAGLARHYPHGETAAHAIGYVGRIDDRDMARLDRGRYRGSSHTGKLGAEYQYESVLHGEPGFRRVEVNVQGRVLRVLEEEAPTPGRDIRLTLDLELQRVAEEALAGQAGAVVAIDPRNGEVLALASTPSFDPNPFVNGIAQADYALLRDAPWRPLFNRALRGQYAPGSTVKPILALHALETGVRGRDETIHCNGYFRLPGRSRQYRDWTVHGRHLDLAQALEQSCNVMFYDLAHRMGINELATAYRGFGLGRLTGIDLPGERPGLIPDPEWKRQNRGEAWYPGETVIHGIGQGYMTVTPMQLATVSAILANRGRSVQPRIFLDAADNGPEPVRPAVSLPEPIVMSDPENWDYVVDALVDVTRGELGTARSMRWRSPNVIAGKTGTSQVFTRPRDEDAPSLEDTIYELRNHGLFVAFAPPDRPRIAIGTIVEHGGGGSAAAAPVAQVVIDHWLAGIDDEIVPPDLEQVVLEHDGDG